jgi:hypothetical protein
LVCILEGGEQGARMSDIDGFERIKLMLARSGKDQSYAQRKQYYGDPARHVRFEGEYMQGIKEIENILRYELDNWLRWARGRGYLPASFRVPLGYMFKSTDVHDEARPIRISIDEIGAAGFERIIVSLPQRHREAFIMYQLGKAHVAGKVRIIKGREDCARLLGVGTWQYHNLVRQAHSMVLRKAKSISDSIGE